MIRALIVDDEPAMLTVMRRKLGRINGVAIAGTCRSASEALETIKRNAADLVFVDIKIAEDNGLELARQIREINEVVDLVFVTSHREFAIDSFDAYPLDYIVKPVTQSRLERTISRVAARTTTAATAATTKEQEAAADKLQVRGLGGLEVRGRNGPVKWVSRKSAELFAYLLLHRGRGMPRSRIIEDVFPDMPVENANQYLNTAVYQLRKMLQSQAAREIVLSSREAYSLALEAIDADYIDFERYVSEAGEWDESELGEAIRWEGLYIGELFEGKSYLWAIGERTWLEEQYAAFAKRLIRKLLHIGRTEKALALSQKLVHRHELDEEANGLLLQVYLALNDIAALQKHYDCFSELYRQELGVPVSTGFTELYGKLLLESRILACTGSEHKGA